jgi:hypothetical protein
MPEGSSEATLKPVQLKNISCLHQETNPGALRAKPVSSYMLYSPLNKSIYVRFEVFTAVAMKNGVLWDVTPCGSCKK